jgi:hypothetical protein
VNKTYLIVGGASVASLAAGAVGGYLAAKKRFDKHLDRLIAEQVEATRKQYSVMLMEQKTSQKPASPADIARQKAIYEAAQKVVEEEEPPLTKAQEEAKVKADRALTNYQGMAKPDLGDVVKSNIFTTEQRGKKLPARDENGKFLPKDAAPTVTKTRGGHPDPYIIEPDEFLRNTPEHEQDSLLWFAKDETLIVVADSESFALSKVGDDFMHFFPEGEEPSVVYVRNEGMGEDYQITRTFESLTEYMGLGESDEDLPADEDEDDEDDPAKERADVHSQ